MVQYKYFHTSNGYLSRLSIDRESPDYLFMEKLFESLRTMSEGNNFTYAPLSSGGSVMLQYTADGEASFAHGIACDGLTDYPVKYFSRLETEMEDTEDVPAQLPEPQLPRVSRMAPEFPNEKVFHDFIPKIVDAIISDRDNKQIVIVTENREESVRFMNAISAVLPKQYMARVGFNIGSNTIATTDLSIMRPSGESETVSVKIWLPELNNYRFENYAGTYHVFDAIAGRDSYSSSLCLFAQLLQMINLSESREVSALLKHVASAFTTDGSVDTDRLDTLSTIYLLGLKKDFPVAVKVLDGCNPDNPEDVPAIKIALSVMLDSEKSGALTPEYFEKILAFCLKNDDIAKSSAEGVIEYLKDGFGVYQRLSEGAQNDVASFLCKDENYGTRLPEIFRGWWDSCASKNESATAAKSAFTISVKMLDLGFKKVAAELENDANNRGGVVSNESIYRAVNAVTVTPGAVRMFDLGVFQALENSAKELFDIAYKYDDEEVGKYAIATLMASAHISNNPDHYSRVTRHFKDTIQKLSSKDQFGMILDVRNYLVDIAGIFANLNIKDAESFMFNANNRSGRSWCEEIVGVASGADKPLSNSINELFDAYDRAREASYTEMRQLIGEKLTDVDYVKRKVKPGSNDFRLYDSKIREIDVPWSSAFRDLFDELVQEDEKSKIHGNARVGRALERFKTFSKKEQEAVLSESGIGSEGELELFKESDGMDLDTKKKQKPFVAAMNKRGGFVAPDKTNVKKRNQNPPLFIDIGILGTVVFPLISLLLLLIPALVISAAGGGSFIECLYNNYLNWWFAIPIYCVLEVAAIIFVRMKTEKDYPRIQNTISTGLFANIPVIIFIIVYIVLYFTGVGI